MILDISDNQFQKIFSNPNLHLPIRWDNKDFVQTLRKMFHEYYDSVEKELCESIWGSTIGIDDYKIKKVCNLLIHVVKQYLNGFPSKAFESFCELMDLLEQKPLQTYYKSIMEHFDASNYNDSLNLYRITCVNENIPHDKSRVFHTPYYLRSKVSTSRYSIAGFPSLYLGTSLELCYEEVHHNPHEQFALASRFQLERNFECNNTEIKVIELAIKPQDFLVERNRSDTHRNTRIIPQDALNRLDVREAYLLWYPLIAACSFIRVNKKDPFAVEYIIPQLLMQWIRSRMRTQKQKYNQLVGIRYFSCASVKASEIGFNYVFPASGKQTKDSFCPTLSRAFKLTRPYFLHEYSNIASCEDALREDNNLEFV